MKIRLGKILKALAGLIAGKEIGFALMVLQLISSAFGKVPPTELSSFVYQQLPKRWKSPMGPATEEEFLRMVASGVDFYRTVRHVTF